MSRVSVRIAGPDDAAAVARLMTALNEAVGPVYGLAHTPENVTVTPEQARARMERMAGVEQALLVEEPGAAIGLLAKAEAIARARGCTSIHVNAWHDNAEALSAYRSSGYDAVEVGFEKRLRAID